MGGDPAACDRRNVDEDEDDEGANANSALKLSRFFAAADVDQVKKPQSNEQLEGDG